MAAPAPAAAAPNNNAGPINDRDVEHWKGRINDVLARPSEHINSKSPESAQSWSTAFFGCFDPIDLCLITCCVPCVTFGKTHHRLHVNANMQGYEPINTSCLFLWASGCVGLSAIPVAMQRAEIRQRYNLAGSCVTDLLTACCCGCCDVIQQEKETLAREPLNSTKPDQYQAQPGMQYPGQQ